MRVEHTADAAIVVGGADLQSALPRPRAGKPKCGRTTSRSSQCTSPVLVRKTSLRSSLLLHPATPTSITRAKLATHGLPVRTMYDTTREQRTTYGCGGRGRRQWAYARMRRGALLPLCAPLLPRLPGQLRASAIDRSQARMRRRSCARHPSTNAGCL